MGSVNRFLGGQGADFQKHPKPGCCLIGLSSKYKFRGQSLVFAALATQFMSGNRQLKRKQPRNKISYINRSNELFWKLYFWFSTCCYFTVQSMLCMVKIALSWCHFKNVDTNCNVSYLGSSNFSVEGDVLC